MILNIDLLGIPCAEYCEKNGVKGIFIPEVPNFRFDPGDGGKRGGKPQRAMIRIGLLKTIRKSQKYDFMGRMNIWPEYRDAYMANPNTVNRKRFMAYGYNFVGKDDAPAPVSTSEDFENLLKD